MRGVLRHFAIGFKMGVREEWRAQWPYGIPRARVSTGHEGPGRPVGSQEGRDRGPSGGQRRAAQATMRPSGEGAAEDTPFCTTPDDGDSPGDVVRHAVIRVQGGSRTD